MQPLDRPGRFRCVSPKPLGLNTATDSRSVAAIMEFPITEMYDDSAGTWIDWTEYGQSITAYINIVKKDGEPNAIQAEAFVRHLNWNGDLSRINEGSGWEPKACQITVDEETYQGKTRLKVNWINDWNSEGGTLKKADDATVKGLAAQHGAKFRALAGNIARNTAGGKPPTRPASATRPAPTTAATQGFDDTQYPEPGSNG